MRRLYIFLALVLLSVLSLRAGDLDSILSGLRNSKGTTVLFTNGDEQFMLTMQGDKYRLNSAVMKLLFDGDNLYTYNQSTNELTIEKPAGSTILSNPTKLFRLDSDDFAVSVSDKHYNLTPKNREEMSIDKIVIELNVSGELSKITVTPMSSDVIGFTIDKIMLNSSFGRDEFKFNRRDFDDAEIIDFR